MTFKDRAREILHSLLFKQASGDDFSTTAAFDDDDLDDATLEELLEKESGAVDAAKKTTPSQDKKGTPGRVRSTLELEQVLSNLVPQLQPYDGSLDLCDALHKTTKGLLAGEEFKSFKLTEPGLLNEPNFQLPHASRSTAKLSYYRWRVSNKKNSLSVRASEGFVEIFAVPTDDIPLRSFSEFGARLKGRFELIGSDSQKLAWYSGKTRLTADLIKARLAELLNELAGTTGRTSNRSAKQEKGRSQDLTAAERDRQNVLFRSLNDQEMLKNELARTLHDTVLADLLMLKRHLRGDQELQKEEIIETVDEIAQQLRDLCNEFAPRNLHDWGMRTSLQDLLQRMEQRTGIKCKLNCEVEIPNMPDNVELHIFRMMQEALNNIEKHAGAKKILINVEISKPRTIRFSVVDDGKGFDAQAQAGGGGKDSAPVGVERSVESGGMGLSGMTERVQLIRSYFPAQYSLESKPGQGTTIWVEITVPI